MKSTYIKETQKVAKHIRRLEERREYLFSSLNNDPLSIVKRGFVNAEYESLTWALAHIEKTRQIAFDDAHALDLANPAYHAQEEAILRRIAEREVEPIAGLNTDRPRSDEMNSAPAFGHPEFSAPALFPKG